MNKSINKAILSRLAEAKEILVASHVRPDGDAVGALLGLGLALQGSGKKVQMVLADGVPSSFKTWKAQSKLRLAIDGQV